MLERRPPDAPRSLPPVATPAPQRLPWRPSSRRRRPPAPMTAPRRDRPTANAPRIAILRATASRLACGPVDRALVSRPTQGVSVRRATPVARTRAWSNPRSASRRRASGTHVTTSTLGQPFDLGHRQRQRRAHAAPPRELQPVDRLAGRPFEPERCASRVDLGRRAIAASRDRHRLRSSASAAPWRTEHLEGGTAWIAERPRPGAAPRATLREDDVQRPRQHRWNLPTGTDSGAARRSTPTS